MTWGCSVWCWVSGSAVGTLGRFLAGAHEVQAVFPEDHSGGPDGAGREGLWETDPGSWVGRGVEGLPWRWEQAGVVGLSAGHAELSNLGTPRGMLSWCLGARPDQRIGEHLAHLCPIFFQGHNIHTFDLKLVWVDPGQDR